MLPASYSENIAAVQEILESASEENILVLVYIAPFITEIEKILMLLKSILISKKKPRR